MTMNIDQIMGRATEALRGAVKEILQTPLDADEFPNGVVVTLKAPGLSVVVDLTLHPEELLDLVEAEYLQDEG